MGPLAFGGALVLPVARRHGQVVPWGVPVRRWARTPCPAWSGLSEECFHVEWLLSFEHKVDGAAEFVGEDGECFSFAVFVDQPIMILLGSFVSS